MARKELLATLVVALLGLSGVASVPVTAGAATGISVTPSSGLTDGQNVTVAWSGLPDLAYGILVCDGDLVRTGNGAMRNGALWHLAHHGFGPSWDPMFMQSNLGIVCKAGMWLMPEPEATAQAMLHLNAIEDLAWAVDVFGALRLQRVIEHVVVIYNYLQQAFLVSQRADWYPGEGPMPDDVIAQVIARLGIGYWSIPLRLYGYAETVDAYVRVIQ